jgi:cell division protein FtsB
VKSPLRRFVVRGAALAVMTALLVSVGGGVKRYLVNRREGARLARKVAESEASVTRKRALLGLAQKDDDLLEGEARRQLGLIGGGEIEFRFVPDPRGGAEAMEISPSRKEPFS